MANVTILSSLPKAIVAAAATYQVDPRKLAHSAGVAPAALESADIRIAEAAVCRLWKMAVAATGDPCLGLIAAQQYHATSFYALGFTWLASPSLKDVFRRLVRYERVLLNVQWVVLENRGGRTALRLIQPSNEEPAASCRADACFATLLRWVQHLSGMAYSPAAVEFRHADHGQRNRYEALFKVPLTFGAAADRLWFDDAILERALPGGNPTLAAHADRIADAYLATLTDTPVARQVRNGLMDLLPLGEANLSAVARRLFLSERSLQRHLHDEGHTFRALLDDTREALALDYVRDGQHPLAEVAFRLGFSDQSAFSKAFKRWTDLSPAAYASVERTR